MDDKPANQQHDHAITTGIRQTLPLKTARQPTPSGDGPFKLKDWTVRFKLVLVTIAIVLLIAVITGISYYTIINVTASFREVSQDTVVELKALGEIGANSEMLAGEAREYALFGEAESLYELSEATQSLEQALATYAAVQDKFHIGAEGQRQNFAAQLNEAVADLQKQVENLLVLSDLGPNSREVVEAGEALEAAEERLRTILDEAGQGTGLEVAENIAAVNASLRRSQIILITLFLMGITTAVGISYLLNRSIVRRLRELATVARGISAGSLTQLAPVDSRDEIGQLAAAFNEMTTQLHESIENLEARVLDRTQQLETIIEVSQRLTGILDLSDLLRQVVIITKETFNYYHTHVYLLEGETLVMAEGYGQAGAEMKRRGHSIPLDAPKSLVARSAREGQTITVENVRTDPSWLPNPLLPDTYSEMAVPIKLDSEVVGVLDVQSDQSGGLTKEDEATLETLANQIAVVVRSARLFSQTQQSLYEAQKLQRLYTGQAWEKLIGMRKNTDYEFWQTGVPLPNEAPTPEAWAALQEKRTIDLRIPLAENGGNGAEPAAEYKFNSALATPLKLRGQIIGVLGLQDENPQRQWTENEVALIEAISEQMSIALENARLFEETGRQASREKIIADMTQRVWASGELEQVMRTAVEQLGATLEASKVIIKVGIEEQLTQELKD